MKNPPPDLAIADSEIEFDPNNPQPIEQPDPLTLVTDKVNLWATYVGGLMAVLAFFVIGVLLVIAVILRFGFNASLDYATEIPTFAFPWLIAGGVVAAMGRNGHLAVDYFVNKGSASLQRYLDVFVWVLCTLALAFLVYVSTLLIRPYTFQKSPILGLPMLLSYAAYIYMAVSLTVQSAARAWTAFRGKNVHSKEVLGV
ncbi:TRAP transporter small permease [Pseudarthrobacter sp. NS4]|uniref:TRAP transporter small permease n=1 Tax=Pseudarthrobacter sp. NS4 TaxID=2973976 RepID=UPI0021636A90|nr:TRAP transporter small permease [Pseudarthrobacter sp. NS4]